MKRLIAAFFILLPVLFSCSGERETETVSTNLSVVFSSDLLGKIRSCGCSAEDMGGIGRRATYIESVRNSVSNLLVLDAGDVFSLDLSYSKTEAELTFTSFGIMGVDAFTPGEIEFIFGMPYLRDLSLTAGLDVIAANVVDARSGELILGPAYTIKEFGRLRVGITGVIDDMIRFPGYIDTSSFKVLPPEAVLEKILPELGKKADFLILLSHMGLERSRALAGKIDDFDLIIVGHGKPVIKKKEQVGSTYLLATGGEGQYIGRIDLAISGSGEITYAKLGIIPLREKIAIHEEIRDLFANYGVPLTEKKHE